MASHLGLAGVALLEHLAERNRHILNRLIRRIPQDFGELRKSPNSCESGYQER